MHSAPLAPHPQSSLLAPARPPPSGSSDTTRGFGLLQGLAPIIWFSSFTIMVVVAKWIVIGVQAQGRVPLSTHAYLAWWYNNAMLNVWETIGGRWLLGTKMMTLFYRTMGAKVWLGWEKREKPRAASVINLVTAWCILLQHIVRHASSARVSPCSYCCFTWSDRLRVNRVGQSPLN